MLRLDRLVGDRGGRGVGEDRIEGMMMLRPSSPVAREEFLDGKRERGIARQQAGMLSIVPA